MFNSFLGTGALTIPVPLGAGISLTVTLPHFPVICNRREIKFTTVKNITPNKIQLLYITNCVYRTIPHLHFLTSLHNNSVKMDGFIPVFSWSDLSILIYSLNYSLWSMFSIITWYLLLPWTFKLFIRVFQEFHIKICITQLVINYQFIIH